MLEKTTAHHDRHRPTATTNRHDRKHHARKHHDRNSPTDLTTTATESPPQPPYPISTS